MTLSSTPSQSPNALNNCTPSLISISNALSRILSFQLPSSDTLAPVLQPVSTYNPLLTSPFHCASSPSVLPSSPDSMPRLYSHSLCTHSYLHCSTCHVCQKNKNKNQSNCPPTPNQHRWKKKITCMITGLTLSSWPSVPSMSTRDAQNSYNFPLDLSLFQSPT